MNILFMCSVTDPESPKKPLQKPEDIRFGISYISSLLKQNGHCTELFVLGGILNKKNKNAVDQCVSKFHPELICFTSVASEYNIIAEAAKYIKRKYPDIYLLIGGIHASLNPEEVIAADFDALCIGEGEHPTLELVSVLEQGEKPSGIANLWIKNNSEIEKNPTRPFLQDVDSLPFPDKDIWQEWIAHLELRYSVLLGRGCPFQCTYCCNHALKRLASGPYVRFRSPDSIVQEIKQILEKYLVEKEIYLEVETIGLNKEWAMQLCSKLEEFNKTLSEPISFGANLRVTRNADLRSLLVAFKKANFRFIIIGLESGSERIRSEVLKRNYSNQDIINAVRLAKEHGLQVALNNIIGIPGETPADFEQTVKVNQLCQPDYSKTYVFMPYPGTDLYYLCKEQGLLKETVGPADMDKNAVLNLPTFSRKQIQKSFIWFDYFIYKGRKPVYKILARVLRSKLRSVYYLNQLYRMVTRLPFFQGLVRILKSY